MRGVIRSISLQCAAAREGMGIGFLPCFVGDQDSGLVRIDEPDNYPAYDMWLLRHSDARQTARLHVFSTFMSDAIEAHADRLSGAAGAR